MWNKYVRDSALTALHHCSLHHSINHRWLNLMGFILLSHRRVLGQVHQSGVPPQGQILRFLVVNTVCNITTDFMLVTMPIPLIWQLKMTMRSRIYLVGIFALGYS